MLVLTRKNNEKIVIGENITITINRIAGNRVTVGIDAPKDLRIVRGELEKAISDFDATPQEETVNVLAFPIPEVQADANPLGDPLGDYLPRQAR